MNVKSLFISGMLILMGQIAIPGTATGGDFQDAIMKIDRGLERSYSRLDGETHRGAMVFRRFLDAVKKLRDEGQSLFAAHPLQAWGKVWGAVALLAKTEVGIFVYKREKNRADTLLERFRQSIEQNAGMIEKSGNSQALQLLLNAKKILVSVESKYGLLALKMIPRHIMPGMHCLRRAVRIARRGESVTTDHAGELASLKNTLESMESLAKGGSISARLYGRASGLVREIEELNSDGKSQEVASKLLVAKKLVRRLREIVRAGSSLEERTRKEIDRLSQLTLRASERIEGSLSDSRVLKLLENSRKLEKDSISLFSKKKYRAASMKAKQGKKLALRVIALSIKTGSSGAREIATGRLERIKEKLESVRAKKNWYRAVANVVEKAKDSFNKRNYELTIAYVETAERLLGRAPKQSSLP